LQILLCKCFFAGVANTLLRALPTPFYGRCQHPFTGVAHTLLRALPTPFYGRCPHPFVGAAHTRWELFEKSSQALKNFYLFYDTVSDVMRFYLSEFAPECAESAIISFCRSFATAKTPYDEQSKSLMPLR